MEELIEKYAYEYSELKETDKSEDGNINANNPVIFFIVGDKASEGLITVKETINSKWRNSDGVVYFCIGTNNIDCSDDNTYFLNLGIKAEEYDNKTLRQDIYNYFYSNNELIIEVNNTIKKVKNRVLELGKLYSSREHVNISVITRVDDAINVIVPDLSLLLQSRLTQDFKMVSMDLYNIVREKDDGNSEYLKALAMSYFREIEYFQSMNYEFEKEIEVSNDDIKSKVIHKKKPIFDLTYFLSDKNEKNVLLEDGNKEDYAIIAYVNFIKNRRMQTQSIKEATQKYNNSDFIKNISTPGKASYVSAGLSRIRKPHAAIACAVLYHYIDRVFYVLNRASEAEHEKIKKVFGLDDESINDTINSVVFTSNKIDDMFSLMSTNLNFNEIRKLSFRSAEETLYGDTCEKFFQENCEQTSWKLFEQKNFREKIANRIFEKILKNSKLGIYCSYKWTKEDGILEEIMLLKRGTQSRIDALTNEVEQMYSTIVMIKIPSFFFLFKQRSMEEFRNYLFNEIYHKRVELIRQKILIEYLQIYEDVVEQLNSEFKSEIDVLENVRSTTKSAANRFCQKADEYIGQNIMEYYADVVKKIDESIEEKRGSNYYYEDRFFGNMGEVLKDGEQTFLEKLINICNKYILSFDFFNAPFEKELLERANVKLEYESKAVVLSKEDLFEKLYEILEENAATNIYLFDYTQKRRYEEKYFFGNSESEFIKYAFGVDKTSIYKLGCVDERGNSGIDKLNLIGGFHIEDMVYAKVCKKYYDAYLQKEFKFHGIDIEKLPEIKDFL